LFLFLFGNSNIIQHIKGKIRESLLQFSHSQSNSYFFESEEDDLIYSESENEIESNKDEDDDMIDRLISPSSNSSPSKLDYDHHLSSPSSKRLILIISLFFHLSKFELKLNYSFHEIIPPHFPKPTNILIESDENDQFIVSSNNNHKTKNLNNQTNNKIHLTTTSNQEMVIEEGDVYDSEEYESFYETDSSDESDEKEDADEEGSLSNYQSPISSSRIRRTGGRNDNSSSPPSSSNSSQTQPPPSSGIIYYFIFEF